MLGTARTRRIVRACDPALCLALLVAAPLARGEGRWWALSIGVSRYRSAHVATGSGAADA